MNNVADIKFESFPVPVKKRGLMFPKYFGEHFIITEKLIYIFMEKLCPSYNGGYWDFFETSNGIFFMAPDEERDLFLIWPDNGFEGTLSAEAAGIVACLFAYSYIANKYGTDWLIEAYQKLLDFSRKHEEAIIIARAID